MRALGITGVHALARPPQPPEALPAPEGEDRRTEDLPARTDARTATQSTAKSESAEGAFSGGALAQSRVRPEALPASAHAQPRPANGPGRPASAASMAGRSARQSNDGALPVQNLNSRSQDPKLSSGGALPPVQAFPGQTSKTVEFRHSTGCTKAGYVSELIFNDVGLPEPAKRACTLQGSCPSSLRATRDEHVCQLHCKGVESKLQSSLGAFGSIGPEDDDVDIGELDHG
jgi:hypothetical protein